MSLTLTLILAGAMLAIAVVCGWLGAKPPNVMRGPRMIPYRLIMVSAAACLLMLTVHVVNLLGVKTGR